jgi:hypothetical protein
MTLVVVMFAALGLGLCVGGFVAGTGARRRVMAEIVDREMFERETPRAPTHRRSALAQARHSRSAFAFRPRAQRRATPPTAGAPCWVCGLPEADGSHDH